MDLISFSHLRWNFVFQRPQHLLTRFSFHGRVFYVEEPVSGDSENGYSIEQDKDHSNIWIVVPQLKNKLTPSDRQLALREIVNTLLLNEQITDYMAWYYSPMALSFTEHLKPVMIVYDCMDELSAFKFAPPEIRIKEQELLKKADVVFTGGRSLYEAKKNQHPNIHCFPSSIDKEHFSLARTIDQDPADQASIPYPRMGFFGVIDERLDIPLIRGIAALKPDWHIVLVGPVVKIDPASLPKNENIHYLGGKDYKDLPAYLAGWDIAILPFARNESTRFISPTKTPEYLAGGKPVISTSIRDVADPYGTNGLVKIADYATDFIQAAEEILADKEPARGLRKADAFLAKISWNNTWHAMSDIIDRTLRIKKQQTLSPQTPKMNQYV